jgi:methylamine--corrinoid protein Co-methyltransferase
MGGYAGGPEGTAVVTVATALQNTIFFQSHYHMCFPIHYIHLCNTTRDLLWVISTVGQAISRNTRLPMTIAGELDSGPCTEMVLQEATTYSVAGTVSGLSLMAVEVTNNKCLDHCTGMKREEANELVKEVLEKYEHRIGEAPIGKSFRDCYDAETITPSKEYLEIYKTVKKELGDIGLNI